jgi:uncharacterized ubiquitin-like protein YukD
MDVCVRYNADVFAFKVPPSATVTRLRTLLKQSTGIPPAEQKIIFKGKILGKKKEKLSDYNIGSGSKLLLFQEASQEKKDSSATRRPNRREKSLNAAPLNNPRHKEIIDQGPPDGCFEGVKTPVPVFPKTPFIIYDTSGHRASLSIETEAIFIESDCDQDRIFLSDIKICQCQDLPGYEDRYVALSLETEGTRKTFYFVPKQFQVLFEDYCRATSAEMVTGRLHQ